VVSVQWSDVSEGRKQTSRARKTAAFCAFSLTFSDKCDIIFRESVKNNILEKYYAVYRVKAVLKKFYSLFLLDIRKIDSGFDRRRLNEWQDKDYIRKVIRGYYIFSDLNLGESMLFCIANRIYSPSYVSFESALSHHGLIPEKVYAITSAATRRTYAFETKTARFIYRTIKPGAFFGYSIITDGTKSFKIACIEKAILDYLYINPSLKNKDDFASLRINREVFLNKVDMKKLFGLLNKLGQKRLKKRVNSFMEFLKNDRY